MGEYFALRNMSQYETRHVINVIRELNLAYMAVVGQVIDSNHFAFRTAVEARSVIDGIPHGYAKNKHMTSPGTTVYNGASCGDFIEKV